MTNLSDSQPRSIEVELLVDQLQDAFGRGCGIHPSSNEYVRKKWRAVARHVLTGIREKDDTANLAVELHAVFIGVGHRTEIVNRPEDDPVVRGWQSVASHVLEL